MHPTYTNGRRRPIQTIPRPGRVGPYPRPARWNASDPLELPMIGGDL